MLKELKIAVVLICSVFLIACYPVTRASGIIYDENNVPLAMVKLKIEGKSVFPESKKEIITSADGKYDFGEVQLSTENPIEANLIISREGFEPFSKEIKFGENNVDKVILKVIEKK
jgi:hypothetical protein